MRQQSLSKWRHLWQRSPQHFQIQVSVRRLVHRGKLSRYLHHQVSSLSTKFILRIVFSVSCWFGMVTVLRFCFLLLVSQTICDTGKPCLNGRKCLSSTKSPEQYKCDCGDWFKGKNCEGIIWSLEIFFCRFWFNFFKPMTVWTDSCEINKKKKKHLKQMKSKSNRHNCNDYASICNMRWPRVVTVYHRSP